MNPWCFFLAFCFIATATSGCITTPETPRLDVLSVAWARDPEAYTYYAGDEVIATAKVRNTGDHGTFPVCLRATDSKGSRVDYYSFGNKSCASVTLLTGAEAVVTLRGYTLPTARHATIEGSTTGALRLKPFPRFGDLIPGALLNLQVKVTDNANGTSLITVLASYHEFAERLSFRLSVNGKEPWIAWSAPDQPPSFVSPQVSALKVHVFDGERESSQDTDAFRWCDMTRTRSELCAVWTADPFGR